MRFPQSARLSEMRAVISRVEVTISASKSKKHFSKSNPCRHSKSKSSSWENQDILRGKIKTFFVGKSKSSSLENQNVFCVENQKFFVGKIKISLWGKSKRVKVFTGPVQVVRTRRLNTVYIRLQQSASSPRDTTLQFCRFDAL